MLPIGGNGINYAVRDTAAANLVTVPRRMGRPTTRHLAAVQRRRGWPTRITQAIVGQIQQQAFDLAARSDRPPCGCVSCATARPCATWSPAISPSASDWYTSAVRCGAPHNHTGRPDLLLITA